MLYLIGLGLNDEKDLSLKAVDILKKCSKLYAEFYTNVWNGDIREVEKLAGKAIEVLDRGKTENNHIVEEARGVDIALLVPGDPLSATTHTELMLEAKKNSITVQIIHSSSIFTAVAQTGLHLYKFGRTTTLAKPQENYDPESPYEIIKENQKTGLHTLALLDIGMTAKEAIDLLEKHGIDGKMIACAALGSDRQTIKYDGAQNLSCVEGTPVTIIIPGKLNFKEEEFLEAL